MTLKKVKKIPQRKCIVCQDRDSKKELMRIVKNKEGEIFLDPSGRGTNGTAAFTDSETQANLDRDRGDQLDVHVDVIAGQDKISDSNRVSIG